MTISFNKRCLVAFQVWFWEYTCNANDVLHLLCTNTETSCWTIQNMEWSSVLVYPWLVYPIYALQCLHAIVDTMSILRKPQSFLYLKSYNIPSWASLYTECCCLGVIFCLLFLKSLWVHSFGVIWITISDPRSLTWFIKGTDESVTREVHQFLWCTMIHQWSWITDPDPDNPKEMHPLSLLNLLLNKTSR